MQKWKVKKYMRRTKESKKIEHKINGKTRNTNMIKEKKAKQKQ